MPSVPVPAGDMVVIRCRHESDAISGLSAASGSWPTFGVSELPPPFVTGAYYRSYPPFFERPGSLWRAPVHPLRIETGGPLLVASGALVTAPPSCKHVIRVLTRCSRHRGAASCSIYLPTTCSLATHIRAGVLGRPAGSGRGGSCGGSESVSCHHQPVCPCPGGAVNAFRGGASVPVGGGSWTRAGDGCPSGLC